MVDGARLASPGLLRCAQLAARIDERAVILSHGYHLGSEPQQDSVPRGYDPDAEAALLAEAAWEEDGYRLFDVSVPGGSSRKGPFTVPFESNAIFMSRDLWGELGGFDKAFSSPGGGLVNIDTLNRALRLEGVVPVLIVGEGTFHQVHGGVTTNREITDEHWRDLMGEYERIRGRRFEMPCAEPVLVGLRPPPGTAE